MNKLYFGAMVGILLTGCTSHVTSEPAQITISQNTGPCKIDRNLMNYHINKKKIHYKVKNHNSDLEKSCLLAQEDIDFKEMNVSHVESKKNNFYKKLIPNQNKFKK